MGIDFATAIRSQIVQIGWPVLIILIGLVIYLVRRDYRV